MLGLHENGLTHLLWMQPTRLSTVFEIFCPLGFAHNYYWTARTLGMAHVVVEVLGFVFQALLSWSPHCCLGSR